MRRIMKHTAVVLLMAAMAFAFVFLPGGQNAYATETPVNIDTPDGLHFSNETQQSEMYCNDHEVFLIGYDGDATDLVIPSTVEYNGDNYTVVGIEEESLIPTDAEYYAYWLDHELDSLVLPDTLQYIISHAIAVDITELTIPESVTMIEDHAINCPNLSTIRVLSMRTGSADYYGNMCMGYHWDEDTNKYVMNDGLEVWCVNTGDYSLNESDIQSWCVYNGITHKGFPPENPRWDGNTALWDAPSYRADVVDYYALHISKNGKELVNWFKVNAPACSYDLTTIMENQGKGTYKFYVTAYVGSEHSEITDWSSDYEYNGPVNTFTLTFKPGDGSGTMDPVTVEAGELYTMPESGFAPPSSSKNFKCWKVRDREYGVGQKVQFYANETVTAQWKDKSEPDWTYSIGVPNITVTTAHVGYQNTPVGSIRIDNTGTRPIRGNIDVKVTDDTNDAFSFYNGYPSYIPVGSYNHDCFLRAKKGLVPGTYTCKVTVTPPEPAQPQTATASFTVTDHTWGSTWQRDADNHWKKCTECSARSNEEPHDTNGPVTGVVDATFNNDGYSGDKHCSVCGGISEKGTPTPAGKYITESSAISNPRFVQAGLTYGSMTLRPGDTKYTVEIAKVWDNTNDDRLIDGNKINSTTPFIAGHDYTFELKFAAKGDYVYEESGSNKHRWSTFTFNGAPTKTAVMFDSCPIRVTMKMHCFSNGEDIRNATAVISDQEYTGKKIVPAITLTIPDGDGEYELVKNLDYAINSVSDNIDVGTAMVSIQGRGAFSGWIYPEFTIVPKSVKYADVESYGDKTYTGSAFKPDPVVKVDGRTLIKGTDYNLIYKDSNDNSVTAPTNADWYEYRVDGIGNYTGSYSSYFAIDPADLSPATMTGLKAAYPETSSAIKPTPTITWNGKTLKEGTDYTLSYSKNVKPGTATVKATGKGNFTGTVTGTFKITPSVAFASVTGVKDITYDGNAHMQSLKVVANGKTLVKNADYTLSYKDNKNVGKASVIITGKGYYGGTKTVNFKINPKGTKLKTLKKAKKAITVKWSKQSAKMSTARITGYQILLATDSAFTQNKKSVSVKGYKKTSKKVKKLKGKKLYYVKIRTYKTISGVSYYSDWSPVKTVKTK